MSLNGGCWSSLLFRSKRHHPGRTKNPFSRIVDGAATNELLDVANLIAHQVMFAALHDGAELAEREWDAVVVGSGIGGLTTAALLSRAGLRVLVLEQHERAGGCCGHIQAGGVPFNSGLFYVSRTRRCIQTQLLDHLSHGQIRWAAQRSPFDQALVGSSSGHFQSVDIETFANGFKDCLIQQFPNDREAIENFESLLKASKTAAKHQNAWFLVLKVLPRPLAHILRALISEGHVSDIAAASKVHLKSVVSALTDDKLLRATMAYMPGNLAESPAEIVWSAYCSTLGHYLDNGSHFPIGGSSQPVCHLIREIHQAGGVVRTGADVLRISTDRRKRVSGYRKYATPPEGSTRSHGVVILLVVLDATPTELHVDAEKNYWCSSEDLDNYGKWLRLNKDEMIALLQKPVIDDLPLYFAFPSANAHFQKRYPGKTTCECLIAASAEWFVDEACASSLADRLGAAAWSQIKRYFSQLDSVPVEHFETLSPLDLQRRFGRHGGAVYGNNIVSAQYKDLRQCMDVRPDTDVPGLYLVGQDVLQHGFNHACFSGLLCASYILGRNLFADLRTAEKRKIHRLKEANLRPDIHK